MYNSELCCQIRFSVQVSTSALDRPIRLIWHENVEARGMYTTGANAVFQLKPILMR